MENTFLILGGSLGQVPAIKTAKSLGFRTLVIDKNPNAVGFLYADYVENIDTTNFEEALNVARKYNICGSITISSDIAVPTSCYINETLGLLTQGLGIGEKVTNKEIMKEVFKSKDVKSPNYYVYEKSEDIETLVLEIRDHLYKRPFIVKPSDSSGSRGVTKVNNVKELKNAMKMAFKFSGNGKVVIEEFIKGIEIGAQCFSKEGKMVYCFIHNDKVSNNMIPIGHSFPSFEKQEVIKHIEYECEKALAALGITNGPSNIDIIIDEQGYPYVIEIGARIGATKLPELVKYNSNIDIIEMAINLSAGIDVTVEKSTNCPVAVEMLYFENNGTVREIEDYKHIISSYKPLEFELNVEVGTNIKALSSGIDVYGFVICNGKTAEDAEEKCNEFINNIKAKIHLSEV